MSNKKIIWSLGVLLFRLLFLKYPFDDPSTREKAGGITDKDVDKVLEQQKNTSVSSQAIHFLRSMLRCDLAKRTSIESSLEDPWLH